MTRDKRNAAIVREYQAGRMPRDIAVMSGVSVSTVYVVLKAAGMAAGRDEPTRSLVAKARWQRADYREKQAGKCGRKRVWPDCPAHLQADYRKLRYYMSAADARAALEGLA